MDEDTLDDGMDEAFYAYQEQQYYEADQADLPPHKRDGYAERMFEHADIERKRKREEMP